MRMRHGGEMCLAFVLACALVVGAVVTAGAATALSVAVQTVVRAPWQDRIDVLARVESADHTVLAAPVTGRVQGPFLHPGAAAAGAVIARVEVPGLLAQIRAAQANANLAATDLHRQQHLARRGLVAQQSLDLARVQLQQADAALLALQRQNAQSILRAPFAGTLAYLVSAGTVVYRGTPVATLLGRGQPWARAELTPRQMRRVAVGMGVQWHAGDLHGAATVRSLGQSARTAGMVPVYVALPASSSLLPGQWLWLQLALPRAPAWRVPNAAVVWRGARSEVFVLRAGHAYAVPVQVLAAHGGMSWVRGALGSPATLIISGAARLQDGVAVAVRP
ncbi:MAG: efflux RND transporter periplasmic adaptor subunit [Metallibacterium scheffleri]|jgi:membrane fusion protein (multidrug efflux system)|nr:efflux RND transporter periplasmic adaptor subunit [Metallibacterium scheffleri]MCK9365915.1 efflux RND transporter periplasmic adaptor subunit [Metallibacterium scheffleri]